MKIIETEGEHRIGSNLTGNYTYTITVLNILWEKLICQKRRHLYNSSACFRPLICLVLRIKFARNLPHPVPLLLNNAQLYVNLRKIEGSLPSANSQAPHDVRNLSACSDPFQMINTVKPTKLCSKQNGTLLIILRWYNLKSRAYSSSRC